MKESIKNLLRSLPFALSQNHRYDLQTRKIFRTRLAANSNCIDVGCHKGEIMDLLLQAAPKGQHFGVEPIPVMFEALQAKYKHTPNCTIFGVAVSDERKVSSFNYVVSNPAYSGLRRRDYDKADEKDQTIEIQTELLDDLIAPDVRIDLIKIDVEGAELQVLRGAKRIVSTYRPLVVFEHGLGASNHYGTTPELIFAYFEECKMQIATLSNFLKNAPAMNLEEFKMQYYQRKNYYFIAFAN